MLMQTNADLQSLSIDFTSLESVEFYGGFGPINPDRVYVDQENRLVAFFSREKCTELKNYLKDAAECFYSNNKALLLCHGHGFRDDMESECLIPQNIAKNSVLSGLKSILLAPYAAVTNGLLFLNERSRNVFHNMDRRSISCKICNAISKSRYENYRSNEIEGCFLGIEVGFGLAGDVAKPIYYSMELDDEFQPPNSLQEIVQMLYSIENRFRDANKQNNNFLKNYASYQLSKVNEIFHLNFERQVKYENLIAASTQEHVQVIMIRKIINFLVLAYRWKSATVNFFETGVINCLQLFVHYGYAYYLNNSDTEYLTSRLMLKVQTEINRFLNSFNLEMVSNEFFDNCLGQNAAKINELKVEAHKINQQIEEIDGKIEAEIEKITEKAVSVATTCLTGSIAKLDIPSSVNTDEFCKLMKDEEKKVEEYYKLQHEIDVNVEFREMIYLHLQLQFIKKYFPRCTGTIITIKGNGDEKKYNVQLLL